jgi:sialic acid synthase SpsE
MKKIIKKINLSFNKSISCSGNCFVIAEAGVNHNGSIKISKNLIDIAVSAKADAVKFQTFSTDEIILEKAPKADYHIETTGSNQKLSWYNLLKSQELSYEAHVELINYCKKKRILFMSTPYDCKSVDMLERIGVEIFKIASTDASNYQLLEYIAKKRKPVILSTGMSSLKEIIKSVDILKKYLGTKFVLMQCTGSYPAPIEDANLGVIETYRKKFGCLVGYSDHVMGDLAAIASIPLGISCFEKHITVSKKMTGPDHRVSLNKNEFVKLVKKIRLVKAIIGDGEKKITQSEKKNVKKLKKYLVATKNIFKGQKIKSSDITAKRTGGDGISANEYFNVKNKKAWKNFKKNHVITRNV